MEFIEKAALSTIGPLVSIVLAAVVGQRLSAYWGERQKRRELELSLAANFYASYGEFCAIWKDWNESLRSLIHVPDRMADRRLVLRERACKVEGALEAVLLKIAAERVLTADQQRDLGSLRQAFQVLRKRIEENVGITYGTSEHVDYLEFKRLATFVGVMLAKPSSGQPSATAAYEAFREITANKHEGRWKVTGRERGE